MGTIKDNTGKWHIFSDGDTLWANQPAGSDLNVDLQKNIADEIDSILAETFGNCVLNATSFRITPGTSNRSVNISSGYAILNGQVCSKGTDTYEQNLSYPAKHTFYLEIDDSSNDYDESVHAWPAKITRLTSGTPSGSYMTLGVVVVDDDAVIQNADIADKRFIHESVQVTANNLNDSVTPEKKARSVRRRLGMFANRIKQIIGGDKWTDDIPGSGAGSLTGLWNKFNAVTGHSHSGSANDGGTISASNVSSAVTVRISATNVQGAIEQLDNNKVQLDGSVAMTGRLTLSAHPIAPFHAATKHYVDRAVRVKQLIKARVPGEKSVTTSITSMLDSPLSITTNGGVLKFESGAGVWALPVKNPNYNWDPFVRFYLYRNGVEQQNQTIEVFAHEELGQSETAPEPQYIYLPIPVFYDNPGTGTYTYDLRWSFNIPSTPSPSISRNFTTGSDATYSGFWWYAIEM